MCLGSWTRKHLFGLQEHWEQIRDNKLHLLPNNIIILKTHTLYVVKAVEADMVKDKCTHFFFFFKEMVIAEPLFFFFFTELPYTSKSLNLLYYVLF